MFKKILLATDGSEASEAAVASAFSLAREYALVLQVIAVVDIYGAYYATPESIRFLWQEGQSLLDKLVHRAAEVGVSIETHLLETDVGGKHISDILLAEIARQQADLIILGSHGRRGITKFLMGSVALAICQSAPCSVFIARN